MNEVLLKKIKYLLEFKYNEEENPKYMSMLEKIFYGFLENMEEIYNTDKKQNAYYNEILNKLNDNIKSIIIPSDKFLYHDMGFLELSTNLNEMLEPYIKSGVNITPQLKQEVLKKNYYYYILFALKKVRNACYLDNYFNEIHAITVSKMKKFYKNNFTVICPDGTRFNYFMYVRTLGYKHYEIINMLNILEVIIGRGPLMDYYLNANTNVILGFNKEYDSVLGNMRYDNTGRIKYSAISIINEFVKRIAREESLYKRCEYLKKLNMLLFEMFNYKLTKVLNSKDDDNIKDINNHLKVLEENMLYNSDPRLNNNIDHVKLFKTMKIKLTNYLSNDKKSIRNEYTIYSVDKKRSDKVTSSVQPITIGNKNILLNIMDIKNVNNKILVRLDVKIIDYESLTKKVYDNIYITLKEIKHLFSITDLGVITRESEVIRSTIANRLIDSMIMKVIMNERNNYLGDFTYSKEKDKCIIYKNQGIIDYLGEHLNNEEIN